MYPLVIAIYIQVWGMVTIMWLGNLPSGNWLHFAKWNSIPSNGDFAYFNCRRVRHKTVMIPIDFHGWKHQAWWASSGHITSSESCECERHREVRFDSVELVLVIHLPCHVVLAWSPTSFAVHLSTSRKLPNTGIKNLWLFRLNGFKIYTTTLIGADSDTMDPNLCIHKNTTGS